MINLVLAVFNLIPIPPLDGSHVVGALLPPRLHWQWVQLERYGFLLLFALLWTGFLGVILRPFVNGLLWILLSLAPRAARRRRPSCWRSFEGPLDLLLHLVREEKVSIWDIPIVKICDQYHEALRHMEVLDLEVAGEYLVYAAWLLLIKSRMLLPRHEGEEKDPRQELVERLVEYEKVQAAAAELAGLAEVRRGVEAVRVRGAGRAGRGRSSTWRRSTYWRSPRALREVIERHHARAPGGDAAGADALLGAGEDRGAVRAREPAAAASRCSPTS